jgi:hypothetical protein
VAGCCERGNESFGLHKIGEFLEWLNKVDSNPFSNVLFASRGDINFNPGV